MGENKDFVLSRRLRTFHVFFANFFLVAAGQSFMLAK